MATPTPGRSLKLIKLVYCEHGGSSTGTRSYLDKELDKFKVKFPNVETIVEKRNGRHPCVYAKYENDISQQWSIRNKKPNEINAILKTLTERTGRAQKTLHLWSAAKTKTPSIQGYWHPGLFPTPLVLLNARHLTNSEAKTVVYREASVNHPEADKVNEISEYMTSNGIVHNVVAVKVGPKIDKRSKIEYKPKVKKFNNKAKTNTTAKTVKL